MLERSADMRKRINTGLFGFLLAAVLLSSPLFAGLTTQDIAATKKPPVLDGVLSPGEWDGAFKMTEFKTFQPDYGKDPSQKSEGYFLYDADNLYFAFRGYDTDPSKIKASLCKRDAMFEDDFVGVVLDTYNTMQSGYAFLVNPLGIQGDGMMDINGNVSGEQDFVWYSKGACDGEGYMVEYRIPLQSIRFPLEKRSLCGWASSASSSGPRKWPAPRPSLPTRAASSPRPSPSRSRGLKFKRVVEILPAVTYSDKRAAVDGRLKRDENLTDLG